MPCSSYSTVMRMGKKGETHSLAQSLVRKNGQASKQRRRLPAELCSQAATAQNHKQKKLWARNSSVFFLRQTRSRRQGHRRLGTNNMLFKHTHPQFCLLKFRFFLCRRSLIPAFFLSLFPCHEARWTFAMGDQPVFDFSKLAFNFASGGAQNGGPAFNFQAPGLLGAISVRS